MTVAQLAAILDTQPKTREVRVVFPNLLDPEQKASDNGIYYVGIDTEYPSDTPLLLGLALSSDIREKQPKYNWVNVYALLRLMSK